MVDLTRTNVDGGDDLIERRLTPGMREVLELGVRGHTSKEMARELGLSPYAIDQRFTRACAVFKVNSRREAIRRYQMLETYKAIIYEPSQLHDAGTAGPAFPQLRLSEHNTGLDEVSGYVRVPGPPQSFKSWLPFPTREARTNELTLTQKLFWLGAICLFSIVGVRVVLETLRDLGDYLPGR